MCLGDLKSELSRLRAALQQQEREMEALRDAMARLRDERNAAKSSEQREGERLVAKTTQVYVISRAFFYFSHVIKSKYKKKIFFREVKDSVIFLFFFYFMSFINLYSPL
jgi:predicted  nucleic acid-binding Zn-ribbon protein